jgi:hypothetical protein
MGPPSLQSSGDDGLLGDERRAVESFKKAVVMGLGLAMQTYRDKLADQQEVLMHLADMAIDAYAADSVVLRASGSATERRALEVDAARVFVSDAGMRIEASARQALAIMAEGDALRTMTAALRRLFKAPPVNTAALRRRIADEAVTRGGYVF